MKYIVSLLLLNSCGFPYASKSGIVIYKTKKDYSENLWVLLDASKSKIVAGSCKAFDTTTLPIKLAKGYLIYQREGVFNAETVVTSRTLHSKTSIDNDSLYKLIIDRNPFLEYYVAKNDKEYDTVFLNKVINNNEITKYFDRVK